MAAVEFERVFQIVQTLARGLIAAVNNPAIGVQQSRRAEIAIPIPPIGRARGRAAGAHHTFIQPIKLFAILDRLQPFFGRPVGFSLKPGHDRGMLGIEMRQVWDQILYNRHMRQRIDLHIPLDLIHAIDTGQRIHPVNIHRTGATNPLPAGPAKGQGRINFTLDLDQSIQNHRAACVHIYEIGIHLRGFAIIRVPAINLENPQVFRPFRFRPDLTAGDAGIFRECQLYHIISPQSRRKQRRAAYQQATSTVSSGDMPKPASPKTAFQSNSSAPPGAG